MSNKNPATSPNAEQKMRTKRLRSLMAVNELSAADVAAIIGVKTSTVYVYRCLTSGTVINDRELRLIELELASRKLTAEAAE